MAERVAFICSAGGAVVDAICRTFHPAIGAPAGVITDRPCGAERVARAYRIPHARLESQDLQEWSSLAAGTLRCWGADLVVLLCLRRVGAAIHRDLGVPVWNLHPSLLPAHRGIGALERSWEVEAPRHGEIGVTLHEVTDDLDGGPILGQMRFATDELGSLRGAQHAVFIAKHLLLVAGIERLNGDRRGAYRRQPIAQERIGSIAWQGRFRGIAPSPSAMAASGGVADDWLAGLLAPLEAAA